MKRAALGIVCIGLWWGAGNGVGQSYQIDWYSMDSGATLSAGDAFVLAGSLGQPDVGFLEGGSYTLQGGFWPGMLAAVSVEPPTLTIELDAGGVMVSWSPVATGYALETTEDLGSGVWEAVPGGDTSPMVVPVDTAVRYFRLTKP